VYSEGNVHVDNGEADVDDEHYGVYVDNDDVIHSEIYLY
jgi:hypothetical protein